VTSSPPPAPPPRCPGDEVLVASLTAGLSGAESAALDSHLDSCDRCVAALQVVQLRLALADEIATPVPRTVRARVPGAAVPARAARDWLATVRDLLAAMVRLPVLIPVSVAVGALLMVASQTWLSPTPPREMTRSVPLQQRLRITAPDAVVRVQPAARADAVATLSRGALVDVTGEERDWYRVALPNGTEGWVERRAFE